MGNTQSVSQTLYDKYIRPKSGQQSTTAALQPEKASKTPVTDKLVEKYIRGRSEKSTNEGANVPKKESILLPSVVQGTPNRMESVTTALSNEPKQITTGGYYSRPEVNPKTQMAMESVKKAGYAIVQPKAILEKAGSFMEQEKVQLDTAWTALQKASESVEKFPTVESIQAYNDAVNVYNSVYDRYNDAYSAYSSAYAVYKPLEDELQLAIEMYEAEDQADRENLSKWRSTIRDVETVQKEIDLVETELKELQEGNAAQSDPEKSHQQSQIQKLKKNRELLQEEYDWARHYYYTDLANASDFSEKSKYIPQERKKRRALDLAMDNYSTDTSGWEDPLYEFVNGNEEAGAYISNAAASYYGTDNTLGALFGRTAESMAETRKMKKPEVAIFNYLYATQGKEAAHEYYNYIHADLNYRERKADEQYWSEYATKNPVAASAFSTAMTPIKGVAFAGQMMDYITTGEIDQNAGYNKFSTVPTAIRNQVAEEIEKSGKWGKVGSFTYQTGMSMADFLVTQAVSGQNKNIALAIMGTGAAADGVIAAKDRGLSDNQAFALGTIQGLAEVLMENIGIDALLDATGMGKKAIGYVLQNILAEGIEEGGTTIINTMADVLISKDKSQWEQSIQAYMQKGMDEKEAFWHAAGDQAIALGLDALGGAISGATMGGGTAIVGDVKARSLGADLGKLNLSDADVQAFIQEGLAAPTDSRAYYLAQQMQGKLGRGEKLSNYDLGRLYQANIAQQNEDTQVPAAVEMDAQSQIIANWSKGAATENTAQQGEVKPVKNISLPYVNDTNAQTVQTADAGQTIVNGGIQNANEAESAARIIAAESGAAEQRGTGVPDGSSKRIDGQSTGEQAGVLASRTGETEVRKPLIEQRRAVIDRQNRIGSLRLEKVSSIELGVQAGTEAKNITLVPQEHWDGEMQQLADRIYQETGKNVSFVMGAIQIKGVDGKVRNASGVINGEKIVVRADHLRLTTDQLADHEAYHSKSDFAKGRLHEEIRNRIIERFGEEQFHQVLTKYMEAMRGVYDSGGNMTGEEFEQWVRQVEEEVFADAYAGINAFGAGATRFTDAVNEKMDQLNMGKIHDQTQENGVRETNGPPNSERYAVDDYDEMDYHNYNAELELRGEPKKQAEKLGRVACF